ncbi:MAG: hypothetical protein K5880_14005 [Hydrogenophaga sp.]|uniref:hypothetical protein n=1 Tax=Hydrogenophaga sp. TaxID=1904254 RepID=UPI00260DFBA4|nr:hypothetical protein [Hydrogenophaga sp.]MCV0439736.1 hypothetical protein [Hydrogenophaga sp.]
MVNNNRVFWAIEQVAIKDNAAPPTGAVAPRNSREYITGPLASGTDEVGGLWEVPRGLQSIGISTTFNLEQVFQLGQVELYEYSERQPDIEVTLSKAIDGTKPLFFMVTDPSQANDIVARTNQYRVDIALQIYPDSQFRATGRPQSIVTASGMYVSNMSYTFPIDGFVSEDVTLVGNDKVWGAMVAVSGQTAGNNGGLGAEPIVDWPTEADGGNPAAPEGTPSGVFGHDGNTSALEEGGAQELAAGTDRFGVLIVGSGIQRREEVDIRRSVLPNDVPGIITPVSSGIDGAFVNGGFGAQGPGTALGTDQLVADANTDFVAEHIQTITVSFSIAREDIFELGSKRPFVKVPDFPLEATASIEVITAQGDLVDATSEIDCGPDNTSESNTIILRTCDGLQVDLGDSNRLTSVELGGGEAGGDNMTVTYNYSSFNVFNVSHDFFQPNHRILVFETGLSRFNVGAPSFLRSDLGI